MRFAYPKQKIQDWITQQWVIFWGKKIEPQKHSWLIGPFGNLDNFNEKYFTQLAENEKLIISSADAERGIIPSIKELNFSPSELSELSPNIIDFYENTSKYELKFTVKWSPFFKVFGILLQKLFSNRINQLNIPTGIKNSEEIISEIITLADSDTKQTKYNFWYRKLKSNGQAVYSGTYGICNLPNGQTCVKAVFPLPNGNATVIMSPRIGTSGELILSSAGHKFGDAGFYFLLKDSDGAYWAQFIRSFRDELVITDAGTHLVAKQILTLWKKKVLTFDYEIKLKES